MALINCPECGIEVSEKAIACPKCGCPIVSSAHDSEPNMGSEKKEIEEPLFPTFPTVMNVGKQIVNWSMKAALPNCYYLSELNATKYLKDGKVDVLAHSNGICILCYSDTTSFYISHDQIIDMKFTTHRQIIEQKNLF